MAGRNIELLLLDTVENLGIVGDIVHVKPGHARNYLLPFGLAQKPTPTKIEALKEKRAAALADLQRIRQAREELLERMQDIELSIERACNDQGVLYGSTTQRDIADALQEAGFNVAERSIRLVHPFRRIGEYHVPIQFDKDLRTDVVLHILPDHTLANEIEEMEFDEDGELVEKTKEDRKSEQDQQIPVTADKNEKSE